MACRASRAASRGAKCRASSIARRRAGACRCTSWPSQLDAPADESPLASVGGARRASWRMRVERIAGVDRDRRHARRRDHRARLHAEPAAVRRRGSLPVAGARRGRCAWIFTSATLSLGEDFTHFTSRLGLAEARDAEDRQPVRLRAAEPAVPAAGACPSRRTPRSCSAVIDTRRAADRRLAGRRVRALHEPSRARRGPRSCCGSAGRTRAPYNLYVQGEAPRERLLKEFRDDGNGVLLGTTSFWEGVDVKGEALRLVIIEKLPFASPDDPIVKARIDHLQAHRRQRVPGLPAARGGAGAEAGRRAADPQRRRLRRRGHLRSAARRARATAACSSRRCRRCRSRASTTKRCASCAVTRRSAADAHGCSARVAVARPRHRPMKILALDTATESLLGRAARRRRAHRPRERSSSAGMPSTSCR